MCDGYERSRRAASPLPAATSISDYLDNREDDVILDVLPLSFDYGLYQMIMAFRMGARLVLERSFTFPARVLELMVAEKVTGFPGVPTIFAILNQLDSLASYESYRTRLRRDPARYRPPAGRAALRSRDGAHLPCSRGNARSSARNGASCRSRATPT